MSDREYELKLTTGKTVHWSGKDGEDAARRYVDAHRDTAVIAWREDRRPSINILGRNPVIHE